jgi:RecA-family ATPase
MPTQSTNPLLQSALELADLGVSVIPLWWPEGGVCMCPKGENCPSPAKHPLTFNGLKDASNNIVTIEQWWERYPNANIGLCTGGEIDVIDVDGAIPAYQELIAEIGSPEFVGMVLTGRGDGGLHIYCTPGGNKTIPSGKHGLPNKIEVKGIGGYVVAPPSQHVSGGTYTYLTKITGEIHGDIVLSEWLAKVNKDQATVIELRPTPPINHVSMPATSENVIKYRDAVIESARNYVIDAGEGGRWMALATEAVPKIARGVDGGLIPLDIGIYALESAARQSGLGASEVARIPELIQIMLAQGIKQPITPPKDLDHAVDVWLREVPKGEQADLPAEYVEEIELTPYERAVRAKFAEMRVVDDAKQMLSTLKAGQAPPLEGRSLTEFLAEIEDEERYRVAELWPAQGRVLLAAQAKSGKTTMVAANLIPALVDGGEFLGRYEVEKVTRRVVYLNMEVGTRTMRRWLMESKIDNTGKITVANLRGKAAALSLNTEAGRKKFGAWLADNDAEIVILDPLAPVLASLGLDENNNADVATFFAWWSEALMLGNVVDDLVVHHAGHGGERSRGASRLLDEPDAVWTLTKDADVNTGEDDIYGAASPTRYLSAYGRDVELSPEALDFDMDTRRLRLTGMGRAAGKLAKFDQAVINLMRDGMPRSKNEICNAIQADRNQIWQAAGRLEDAGRLDELSRKGKGYTLIYVPTPSELSGKVGDFDDE